MPLLFPGVREGRPHFRGQPVTSSSRGLLGQYDLGDAGRLTPHARRRTHEVDAWSQMDDVVRAGPEDGNSAAGDVEENGLDAPCA